MMILIFVTSLLSLTSGSPIDQKCGVDCVQVLRVAVNWAVEKSRKHPTADSMRTSLDISPRLRERPRGTLHAREEVAALRRIADDAGLDVMRREQDEAYQACLDGATSTGCLTVRGRTLIHVEGLRLVSSEHATVHVNVTVLGGFGGKANWNYHLFSLLNIEKVNNIWTVVGHEYIGVT